MTQITVKLSREEAEALADDPPKDRVYYEWLTKTRKDYEGGLGKLRAALAQPEELCPECGGDGYVYAAPVQSTANASPPDECGVCRGTGKAA